MPGSVQISSPTTVMPRSLSNAWTEAYYFEHRESGPYQDNRTQRAVVANSSRRSWDLQKRLTFAEWVALYDHFAAMKGALTPFWFYPIDADFDASGTSSTGRIPVRFDGQLSRTYSLGRQAAALRLIEVS
jgi:hypothetical protein